MYNLSVQITRYLFCW